MWYPLHCLLLCAGVSITLVALAGFAHASVMYTYHICSWWSLFWSKVCPFFAFYYVHWAGGVAGLFSLLSWWSPCIEIIGIMQWCHSIGTTSSIRVLKPRWLAEIEATIWPVLYCIWTPNWWRFKAIKYTLLHARGRGGKCSDSINVTDKECNDYDTVWMQNSTASS